MPHAEYGGVQENVLAACEFAVKSGPHLQQAAYAPLQFHMARGGAQDSRQDFEQRRLAGAVAPDDSENFSGRSVETDILESQEAGRWSGRGVCAGRGKTIRASSDNGRCAREA